MPPLPPNIKSASCAVVPTFRPEYRGEGTGNFLAKSICRMSIWCGLFLVGCAAQQDDVQRLRAGYDALNARQLDAALAAADGVLADSPKDTLPAEAHYLRGRVFEERAITNPEGGVSQFQTARTEYAAAIDLPHKPDLDGRARAGLANVAFHQDDYATAAEQWTAAYYKLEQPKDQLLTLYQLGRTEQRLGKWNEADESLAGVQRGAAGTELATKARLIQGARGFTVQFATFSNHKQAEAAVVELRKQGVMAQHFIDPANPALDLVRVISLKTYSEAKTLKARFSRQYTSIAIFP